MIYWRTDGTSGFVMKWSGNGISEMTANSADSCAISILVTDVLPCREQRYHCTARRSFGKYHTIVKQISKNIL